ncbi:hypothetical protein MRX96_005365 [Rhipicephalus microplus]
MHCSTRDGDVSSREGECVPVGVHAPRVSGSRITASQGCSAEGKKQARFAATAFELRRLVVDSQTPNAIPRAAAAASLRSTSLGADPLPLRDERPRVRARRRMCRLSGAGMCAGSQCTGEASNKAQ